MIQWLREKHQPIPHSTPGYQPEFNLIQHRPAVRLQVCLQVTEGYISSIKLKPSTSILNHPPPKLETSTSITLPRSAPSSASLVGINKPLLLAWETFFSLEARVKIMLAIVKGCPHVGENRRERKRRVVATIDSAGSERVGCSERYGFLMLKNRVY